MLKMGDYTFKQKTPAITLGFCSNLNRDTFSGICKIRHFVKVQVLVHIITDRVEHADIGQVFGAGRDATEFGANRSEFG
jgi:cytosine/adenosine deaminase-related metal-dependent hydrolase